MGKAAKTNDVLHSNGPTPRFQMFTQKTKSGASVMAAQLVVSPISPTMAPTGDAQRAATQLLRSIFECLVEILGRC
jgi:exocyst complex component 4